MDELTVEWIDGLMALDGLIGLETEEEDGWCVFLLRKKKLFIMSVNQDSKTNAC